MRDAFGGVFTMNFLLVFIFIYVAFTAVSLNYAKAYRVKNAIIDFVEQNEIQDLDTYFSTALAFDGIDGIDQILDSMGYNKTCSTNDKITIAEGEGYCYRGVIILASENEVITGTNSKIQYYTIKTYADWELGALNKLMALAGSSGTSQPVISGTWEVTGKAKVVIKN